MLFKNRGVASEGHRKNHGGPMNRILLLALASTFLFAACTHGGHSSQSMGRDVNALTDKPTPHKHGGSYSYNPSQAVYEYMPNEEDIVARHSFIMLGADQSIGYHVSFFESRHQHQVILKMDFRDAKTGKKFDMSKLPKPVNGFISATVAAGTAFELYTIANGSTQEFPVTFFDGIIGSGKAVKTNPTNLRVEKIYHFNRMFASERAKNSQYMVFKTNNPKNAKEYVMAHVIQGLREKNLANYEQLVVSTLTSATPIEDGSILVLDGQDDTVPLQLNQTIMADYLRAGFDEKTTVPFETVTLTVNSQTHLRDVPIDAGQKAAKEALGL